MLPVLDSSPRHTLALSLVTTNRLLGCNLLDLPSQVLAETADNPALQLLTPHRCPRCGFPLDDPHRCAVCRHRSCGGDATVWTDDWEARLAAPDDFRSELLVQARLLLDRADYHLAEFIIAALDEHGLLSGEAAQVLPQRAERVLRVIQSLDPPGIAARNTAECFRLQLERLEAANVPRAVYRLIERWPALSERHAALARQLDVTEQELDEALAFMRARLRPYPIMDSETRPYQHVDVAILPAGGAECRFDVIVAPGPRVRACDDPATLGETGLALDDWRALAQHGHLIARALLQRERIIHDVFVNIAQAQAAFLLQGLCCHRPLTRAEIAQAVGVHPSTVGRAVANKAVLIPAGQIIPAALFFERGVAIKQAIRDLVAQADAPLSDEQLRQRLAMQGIVIARRTVAKYRAAAGVLPIHLQWNK